MDIDLLGLSLFTLAALVLLGSPGPAIAALVAVGRSHGFTKGLGFYGGLQVGLALAAGVSAAGLFSLIQAFPIITFTMTVVAALYLAYLSYKIATAPVGPQETKSTSDFASTPLGGFVLGITNPKAYVAFVSLMASYSVVRSNTFADSAAKWLLCVIVMIVVDIVWLWLGVIIQKANLRPEAERMLNIVMGATILLTAVLAFV
ncbi:LysE family translocator [Microvirga sp. ACRRW]|uniref:LysE family translocator n=1 Tax=Microvirga sp. ACRRW TaxID=2918205 RepID=UPI001EF64BBC|nr:LysE family translocator [Microvirga sp. ACRRW]MCG7393788.1 LysE family translocator [Microvirga sp. ACRRW]